MARKGTPDFHHIADLVWEILEELEPAVAEQKAPVKVQSAPTAKTDLTAQELADTLGMDYAWVPRHADEFPGAYRIGGPRGRFRFPKDGVEEWKRQNRLGRKAS